MSKCPECQIRPIGGGPKDGTWNDKQDARQHEMCMVCLAEAYWTNAHSDYAHSLAEVQEAGKDEAGYLLKDCWVCRPELDKSAETYAARIGTSRQGMEMVVSLRANAATKAAQVKAQLPEGFRTKIEIGGALGVTSIHFTGSRGKGASKETFEANWDGRGRWTSGTVNGRKVRNAKELLRVLAAA